MSRRSDINIAARRVWSWAGRTFGVAGALALATSTAQAGPTSAFWSKLDRDGYLSAGWVEVLPVLSAACNVRIDPSKVSALLMDLSRTEGNRDYARDLYQTLYRIEKGETPNRFVNYWNARFHGDQTAACATAAKLWGAGGTQFSGLLISDPTTDATGTVGQPRPNSCP